MENKMHMSDLHTEFRGWVNNLIFYKDEISSLQNRLGEVVKQNNTPAIMTEVEHFQNQFIRQNEVIDILKHDITIAEAQLAQSAQDNITGSANRLFESPGKLKEQVEIFDKIYSDLKKEFEQFLSKTL